MGKGITDVIEDRIDMGKDAMRAKIKMAQASPHPSVRDAATAAKSAVDGAFRTLADIESEQDRCTADAKALGTTDDPRQGSLPGDDDEPGDDDLE